MRYKEANSFSCVAWRHQGKLMCHAMPCCGGFGAQWAMCMLCETVQGALHAQCTLIWAICTVHLVCGVHELHQLLGFDHVQEAFAPIKAGTAEV